MIEFSPKDPSEEKAKKSYLWLKILIPSVALILAAVWVFIAFFADGRKAESEYKELSEKVKKSGNFAEKYTELIKINEDFAGYLNCGEAEFPVVRLENRDAEYYSSHLFSGADNKYGTPYTKSELSEDSAITVITAMSFGDGRMLDSIKNWQKKGENSLVSFESKGFSGEFAPFAAFSYSEEPFLIERVSFLNSEAEEKYIADMKKNSKVDFKIACDSSDKLLVLVALGEKETSVLALRMLREGETKDNLEKPAISAVADPQYQENSSEDDKPSSAPSSKPESSSSESTSSGSKPKDPTPAKNDDDIPVSENYETGRFEQTGLTDSLDKTVKVEVGTVVKMIDVVGMTKAGAKNIVSNTLGLSVKIIEQESDQKRGTVISQSVDADAEISTDVTVTLYVSRGVSSGKTIMPDLVGGLEASAEIVLDNADLRLGKVSSAASSLEKGTILEQSAEAGSEIAVNTKINLTVSDGSIDFKTVKMPNLEGKSKEKAKAAIKAAGLKVGSITKVSSSAAAGTVITQECPAGEKIEEGSTVGFGVSNGSKVNNLTVTNISSWSVNINGKNYPSGAIIKGDYMDIIPYIVEAEMGSGFGTEALKAQAVAAYCWLINAGSKTGAAPGVPMKNPGSKAIEAARAVSGQELKYKNETAQTYYYAIAAGYSANCKDVWWADIPYLRAVESPGDKDYSGYKTKVSYSSSKMQSMIYKAYGIDVSGIDKSKWFSIKYDENNAYVRSVSIGGKKNVTGSSIRDTLCGYDLRSTAFKVKYNAETDKFVFTVYGYGHGVGMSQVGANYYAGLGLSYKQILLHYYPGTTLN